MTATPPKEELIKTEAKNVSRYDFDLDKQRAQDKPRDGKSSPFTLNEWAEIFLGLDDIRRKRSVADVARQLRLHLLPFFSEMLLTEINREP